MLARLFRRSTANVEREGRKSGDRATWWTWWAFTEGFEERVIIMILYCSCKHKFQDKTYGKGKRLMNAMFAKKGDVQMYRCTVCGKERGK